MKNDTVREELQTKITPGIAFRAETKGEPIHLRRTMPTGPAMFTPPPASTSPPRVMPTSAKIDPPMVITPPLKRQVTAGLVVSKTSPTLVDFQNKNASLPDWRIQLQNTVRQRTAGQSVEAIARPNIGIGTQFPTNGGAALKAEIVPQREPAAEKKITDPRVAAALKRIEDSRKAFLRSEDQNKFVAPKPNPFRSFGVVPPNNVTTQTGPALLTMPQSKPTLVPPMQVAIAVKRDTNKLPPIEFAPKYEPVEQSEPAAPVAFVAPVQPFKKTDPEPQQSEFAAIKRIRIRAESAEGPDLEMPAPFEDEIEDLAPFSMRFGAGLFDFIIGAFVSMLLLSPIAFTNGNWFTPAGLLTFAATTAIIMFLYMTVCLGFTGKTIGMRLFSLELVDAAENEYPTLHQAAVNSAVYILSLVLGGSGFLTIFFNEEKRAAHDLLSGTILVREF